MNVNREKHLHKIVERYGYGSFVKELGSGAYSTVALFVKDKQKYAVKISLGEGEENYLGFETHLLEVNTFCRCVYHPNIVNIYDYFSEISNGKRYFFIVIECGDTNLDKKIQTNKKINVRETGYQIACGLQHTLNNNVLNGDVKTENIICFDNGRIAVTDFGLSQLNFCSTKILDDVAYTYNWRAPEIYLGANYTETAESWAFGLILYTLAYSEINLGREKDALGKIFEIFGIWEGAKDLPNWNKKYQNYRKSHFSLKVDPSEILLNDLIKKLLKVDPNERISISEALKHEYFKNMNYVKGKIIEYEEELSCSDKLKNYDFKLNYNENFEYVFEKSINHYFELFKECEVQPQEVVLAMTILRRLVEDDKKYTKKDIEQLFSTSLYFSFCHKYQSCEMVIDIDYIGTDKIAKLQNECLAKLGGITKSTTPCDYIDLFSTDYDEKIINSAYKICQELCKTPIPFEYDCETIGLFALYKAFEFEGSSYKVQKTLEFENLENYVEEYTILENMG